MVQDTITLKELMFGF